MNILNIPNMLDLIQIRTSYRGRYEPEPVPREDLRKLWRPDWPRPRAATNRP